MYQCIKFGFLLSDQNKNNTREVHYTKFSFSHIVTTKPSFATADSKASELYYR